MVKRLIQRWRSRLAAAKKRRQGDVAMVKMAPGTKGTRSRWHVKWENAGRSLAKPGPRLLTRTFLFLFLVGAAYGLWRGSLTAFPQPDGQLPPPVMFESDPLSDGPLLAVSPPAGFLSGTGVAAESGSGVEGPLGSTVDTATTGKPDAVGDPSVPATRLDTEGESAADGVRANPALADQPVQAPPMLTTPVDLSEMVWPVTGGVTANYGWQRDPVTNEWHFRPGLVIAPERDPAPVRASLSGTVADVRATASGYRVVLSHADGWSTEYTGLDSAHVRAGDYVPVGEAIGELRSGAAIVRDGLYFVIRNGDGAVNPSAVLYELPVW